MSFIMFKNFAFKLKLSGASTSRGCWALSKAYSVSTEMITWFLSFILLTWHITLISLCMLTQPGNWPWCLLFWYVVEFGLLNFIGAFWIMFISIYIYICNIKQPIVFSLAVYLTGVDIKVILPRLNVSGCILFSSIFGKSLRSICNHYFLIICIILLVELSLKPSGPGLSLWEGL